MTYSDWGCAPLQATASPTFRGHIPRSSVGVLEGNVAF